MREADRSTPPTMTARTSVKPAPAEALAIKTPFHRGAGRGSGVGDVMLPPLWDNLQIWRIIVPRRRCPATGSKQGYAGHGLDWLPAKQGGWSLFRVRIRYPVNRLGRPGGVAQLLVRLARLVCRLTSSSNKSVTGLGCFQSPDGAKKFSPGRKPWVLAAVSISFSKPRRGDRNFALPLPPPLSRPCGRGCRRRG